MKFGNRKWLGIFIIALVYALAGVAGVIMYVYLPFAFWLNLLIADIAATLVTFVFSVIFKNASVYDPYWSVQPIVILIAFAFKGELGWSKILPLVVTLLWGIRLTANWGYTFRGLAFQDWRYTMLHEKTGKWYPVINFLGIHLVPTLVVYGCILPAVFTFVYAPAANVGSVLFFVLSLCAVALQGVADVQMHKFRKRGKGGFIREGLWRYSRHPNYLGEILMWWGIGLAAVCAMPQRWYLLGGALANTLLFTVVSILMADGRQSKKEGFDAYKKETRALLPLKK